MVSASRHLMSLFVIYRFNANNGFYRGTIFGWGDKSYQPVQSPLFCIASLLAPMVGYAVAFTLLGAAEKPRNWRVIGAGLIAGLVTIGDELLVSIPFESGDL